MCVNEHVGLHKHAFFKLHKLCCTNVCVYQCVFGLLTVEEVDKPLEAEVVKNDDKSLRLEPFSFYGEHILCNPIQNFIPKLTSQLT